MRFKSEERYGATVLHLKGDVMGGPDGATFHDELRRLTEAGQTQVVVDLAKVRFMNSSGLGILIGGLTTMRNAGGDLRLANAADRIQSLLMVSKLLSTFQHFDSVDDAVASYNEAASSEAPSPEAPSSEA